jgi:transcriptional regulator with XRE-family HTH domain
MTKRPNQIDKHVGSRIRMRRLTLDLSQEALAKKLGLTFQQVQKYEKGVNRVSASRLLQLSNILQVPVPFFFEGAPTYDSSQKIRADPTLGYVSDFMASSEGLALAEAFRQIDDRSLRRSIVDLVKRIASVD